MKKEKSIERNKIESMKTEEKILENLSVFAKACWTWDFRRRTPVY